MRSTAKKDNNYFVKYSISNCFVLSKKFEKLKKKE